MNRTLETATRWAWGAWGGGLPLGWGALPEVVAGRFFNPNGGRRRRRPRPPFTPLPWREIFFFFFFPAR